MKLTLEEMYLLSRSDTSARETAAREIRSRLPFMDEEDLKEIARNTIVKLEAMTDSEFEQLEIFADEADLEDPESLICSPQAAMPD